MFEVWMDYVNDWGEIKNYKIRSYSKLLPAVRRAKKVPGGMVKKYSRIIYVGGFTRREFQEMGIDK